MIIATLRHSAIINRYVSNIRKSNIHCSSMNLVAIPEFFSKYIQPKRATPPYNHICQIGDPVLRQKALPVSIQEIQTMQFQKTLHDLYKVMEKYEMQGLSAPQIGIFQQIFAIQVKDERINKIDSEVIKEFEIQDIPLTYFINPKLRIKDPEEVTLHEVCGSVFGYTAKVPRAKEIEITALNPLGKSFRWSAKGMLARIAQHEFDHLQGILFIDKMIRSTFECCFWEELNKRNGKLQLKFHV